MKPTTETLPPEVAALLADTPVLTPALRERLQRAADTVERDPGFHADYLKGVFVEEIRQALIERQENQSSLARRWGRSRQYLSKVFAEDKRVNFTIETLCELAHLVGLRVQLLVTREDEESHVLRFAKPRAIHRICGHLATSTDKRLIRATREEFNQAPAFHGGNSHAYDAA